MLDTRQAVRSITSLAQRLDDLPRSELAAVAREAARIEAELALTSSRWLAGAPDADQVGAGVQFALAGIESGPAVKALETASQWSARQDAPQLAERVVTMNLELAQLCLLGALAQFSRGAAAERALQPPVAEAGAEGPPPAPPPPGGGAADGVDLAVLRNIATYHREHERFYTQAITETAVDLYREANKLRILAGVWLVAPAAEPTSGVDYRAPQYQAAGCVDLNALAAIPAIGVLFMEGEGEPAEIRVMKAKLQGLAGAWLHAGQWLAGKMVAAWGREQALYRPELIELALPRFNTIATNWRGARQTQLAGRVLGLAVAALQGIQLQASAVRASRQETGGRLLHAAWIIVTAGQIQARNGAFLADNDRNWTAYLDGLARLRKLGA